MKVIDASVALEILSRSETGLCFEEELLQTEMHAPYLIDLEVVNTLRRWTLAGRISSHAAEGALQTYLDLPIIRHPHVPLIGKVWELRHNLTAYDAAYIALADMLGAQVVTMDSAMRKLANRGVH